MFERLFKFTPLQFSEGAWGFQAGEALLGFAFLVVFLLLGFGMVYYLATMYRSDRRKGVSLTLRVIVLLLLCLPLFEPVLIVPDVAPRENFVAVLIDASQSMTIPDGTYGPTRRADVRHILSGGEDAVLPALKQDFKLRYYTFSGQVTRVDTVDTSRVPGTQTNITAALERVLNDFKGAPLAGILLLTDGGDNSSETPLAKAEELRGRDIPLHIVGLGRETLEHDREILDVTVSKHVETATGAAIDLKVRSSQTESRPVTFSIYRDEELVFTENRRLTGEGAIDQLSFFFEPEVKGAHEYTVTISDEPDERNSENNSLPMLIDTRNDTMRVLYFEGHPRRDFKFIKRALTNDPGVNVASILRTGPGRYYRQGVHSPDELAGGFPATKEKLFAFEAVILGDIEAGAFTLQQLRMIEQFVRVRGGGFLMLGGRSSFSAGNYLHTPIAEMLPVVLDPVGAAKAPVQVATSNQGEEEAGFLFTPTAAGLENPILKLSSNPTVNRSRWRNMPHLTSINYTGGVKPGAVVLAYKPAGPIGERAPLLVAQRYGKGRTMALTTASTWRWQMQMDSENTSYERFWRQLIRWLTASASGRINVELQTNRLSPGENVPITVRIYDKQYQPLDSVQIRGVIEDPFGRRHTVTFQRSLAVPGTYETSFRTQDSGVHTLTVTGRLNRQIIGIEKQPFLVHQSKEEFHDATLKKEFLQELAEASGGYYYEPSAIDNIPANFVSRTTSHSIYHVEYLWDMPLIFGLIIVLLSIEWVSRRRQGLP